MSALRGGRRRKGHPGNGNGTRFDLRDGENLADAYPSLSLPSDSTTVDGSPTARASGPADAPPGLLLSALVLLRCLSVIAFGAAALMSFTNLGSRVFNVDGAQQALAIALAATGIMAAFAAWLRYRSDRSSQSLRSEEHTSELQSHSDLVCRLLLEKKKQK